jgi:hypothetical protein
MDRSAKIGTASLVLLPGCVLPSPFGAVCAVISCLLGFIAAHEGSKWWLLAPFTTITVVAGLLYIGFHAT